MQECSIKHASKQIFSQLGTFSYSFSSFECD